MPSQKTIFAGLVIAALPFVAGCHRKDIQVAPPTVTAAPAETKSAPEPKPAPPATKTENKKEPATPPTLEVPPPKPAPAKKSAPTTQPTAPAPTPVPPATEPEAPKTPPPQMTPRLPPKEQADAERATRADISTAEKNLNRVGERPLSASQKDMVEKIRGFLAQAHEAMAAIDWVRARNLAQKARLLSVELVKSL